MAIEQSITIATFEQWVDYIFDHPVDEPAWHWDIDAPSWNENGHDAEIVDYMTELFENADVVLAPFTNAQLNQGLWFLADNSCSNHMFALLEDEIPWALRERCIRAMPDLFQKCFAKRCSTHISHGQYGYNPEIDVLNAICYMWFDIIPIHGRPDLPDRRNVDDAFLETIERILYIPHDACRESGLHGMGEWSPYYSSRVTAVIERFLDQNPDLNPGLMEYAARAAVGYT